MIGSLRRASALLSIAAILSAAAAPTATAGANDFVPPGVTTDIMRTCAPYAAPAFAHYIAVNGTHAIRPDGTVGRATVPMARKALAGEVYLLVTSRTRSEIEADLRSWPQSQAHYDYKATRFMKCAWERRIAQLGAGTSLAGAEVGRAVDTWTIMVCNKTSDTINVAAEYREPGSNRWVSRGWWVHPVGVCSKDLETSGPVIFLYANWGAREWPGQFPQCVNPAVTYRFYNDERVNNQCPPGMPTRNFIRVELDATNQVYTYTFLPH
jgi:uncharacterized membrane protein